MQNLIDAPELRRLLSYDPETGEFRWRVSRRGVTAGALAGTLNHQGYWRIFIYGKAYLGHRLVWLYVYGEWPQGDIDHVNRTRSDNRLCNLRVATRSQNLGNMGRRPVNTSGYKGVTWHKRAEKWLAQISVNRKNIYLGLFNCPIAAHAAYIAKARSLFGEFARAA